MGVSNRHHFNMYKLLVSAALLVAVMADSPPAYAPAPAYHAAPVYKEEKLPPQPFAYEYGVADDYSKANFKKTESQDGNGVVTGSFVIAFPMAESRPPPTLLITTTDSSLRSPTREPQSTPQSPRRDTAMPPPTRLPLMPQPLLTSPLLNYFLD